MSTSSSAGVVGLGATTRGGLPAPRRRSRARVAARTVNAVRAAAHPSPSAVWPHRGAHSGRRVARRGDAVRRRGFLDRLFGGDKKETGDGNGDETPAAKPSRRPARSPSPRRDHVVVVLVRRFDRPGSRRLLRRAQAQGRVRHAQAGFQLHDVRAGRPGGRHRRGEAARGGGEG